MKIRKECWEVCTKLRADKAAGDGVESVLVIKLYSHPIRVGSHGEADTVDYNVGPSLACHSKLIVGLEEGCKLLGVVVSQRRASHADKHLPDGDWTNASPLLLQWSEKRTVHKRFCAFVDATRCQLRQCPMECVKEPLSVYQAQEVFYPESGGPRGRAAGNGKKGTFASCAGGLASSGTNRSRLRLQVTVLSVCRSRVKRLQRFDCRGVCGCNRAV